MTGGVSPFSTILDPQEGWTLLLPSLQTHTKLRGAPAQQRSKGLLVHTVLPAWDPRAAEARMPCASPSSDGELDIPATRRVETPPHHHPHSTAGDKGVPQARIPLPTPTPPVPSLAEPLPGGDGERVAACAGAKMTQSSLEQRRSQLQPAEHDAASTSPPAQTPRHLSLPAPPNRSRTPWPHRRCSYSRAGQ